MNSESLRAWLESYRMAWETRDPDLVVLLFAQDATYQETPFTETMRGREAIRQYWSRAVVSYQEQIRFGYEILAVTEAAPLPTGGPRLYASPQKHRYALMGSSFWPSMKQASAGNFGNGGCGRTTRQ